MEELPRTYKCQEDCGYSQAGECVYQSRLGLGNPHKIKPGDICLFSHIYELEHFSAITSETS